MDKLELKHYNAIRNLIRNSGIADARMINTANEGLAIIKELVKISDEDIAAKLQELKIREKQKEYVNSKGEIFIWTDKGFTQTGVDFTHMEHYRYCSCAYPKRHELHNKCDKCGKQMA